MGAFRFGILIRGQYGPDDDLTARLEELMEQARLARAPGFDCLLKSSHYSIHPSLEFQQIPLLARLAAEASGLRIGAGVVLLPLHKPLDLAEQFATLDVITGGKAIFSVGIGYRDVEFKAFGTARKEAALRFEESLAVIRRLWTEEFVSHQGTHFTLEDASCALKPLQRPHPPIWIGANADVAIERAARIGDTWFVNPHNRMDTIARQTELYRRALEAAGKPFPDEFPLMREVFVAPTREEAAARARPYLEKKYWRYHQWGQDKAMPEGDDNLGLPYEELIRDRFLLGSPDEVAGQILGFARTLGVNHLVFGIQWAGMPQSMVLDEMHLLAEEVFPRVRAGL